MTKNIKIVPRYRVDEISKKYGKNKPNSRKKTTEQYKKELETKNPNIEVLEEYIDAKTNILHKCLVCNNIWTARPYNILSGKGCPECANKNRNNKTRKTSEQYKDELKQVNPNIELVGEYLGTNVPTLHKCLLCNNTWNSSRSSILKGSSCPKCGKRKIRSHDDYVNDVFNINSNILVKGQYKNTKENISHECKICGNVLDACPNNILSGKGCPECAKEIRASKRRFTHEQYAHLLKIKNDALEVVGNYVGMSKKIEHICKRCNKHIFIQPTHALEGQSCKSCASKKVGDKLRLTPEQFKQNVYERNSNIELITDYVGANNPITCKCMICNHIWTVSAPFQLYSSDCPNCVAKEKGIRLRNTHEEFEKSILPNITLLSEYKGCNNAIDCSCDICGYIWTVNQSNSLRRSGCPNCKKSHGENLIKQFLDNENIKYVQNKKFKDLYGLGNGYLSYDFYLIDYNMLIEVNGKQHEFPIDYFGGEKQFEIQQEHDRRKREYVKNNGYELLEIWYYDLNNAIEMIINKLNLKLESLTTTGVV